MAIVIDINNDINNENDNKDVDVTLNHDSNVAGNENVKVVPFKSESKARIKQIQEKSNVNDENDLFRPQLKMTMNDFETCIYLNEIACFIIIFCLVCSSKYVC